MAHYLAPTEPVNPGLPEQPIVTGAIFLTVMRVGLNAGVELGQAAVVLVAVPALGLVGRAGWERRMVWALSAAILVVGLALFVERALL